MSRAFLAPFASDNFIFAQSAAQPAAGSPTHQWAIAIHGGAGESEWEHMDTDTAAAYHDSLAKALAAGTAVLKTMARPWTQLKRQLKCLKMIRSSMPAADRPSLPTAPMKWTRLSWMERLSLPAPSPQSQQHDIPSRWRALSWITHHMS